MALTEIPVRQSIRFLKTADGVTLAWAEAGVSGPGQGRQLAQSPGVRLGQPVLATLDAFFCGELPVHPL